MLHPPQDISTPSQNPRVSATQRVIRDNIHTATAPPPSRGSIAPSLDVHRGARAAVGPPYEGVENGADGESLNSKAEGASTIVDLSRCLGACGRSYWIRFLLFSEQGRKRVIGFSVLFVGLRRVVTSPSPNTYKWVPLLLSILRPNPPPISPLG